MSRRLNILFGVALTASCAHAGWRLLVPPGADDAVAQLRYLDDAIADGAATDMQRLFPEGFLFTHALVGLAWIDVGLGLPEGAPLRDHAAERARAALTASLSEQGRLPFPAELPPDHGAFYAGWTTWLRAGIHQLDPDPAERAALVSACAIIAEAYGDSETPFLPSYQGAAWPVDSVVAVTALAPCQRATGIDHGAVIERWLRQARAANTPLIPHTAHPETGAPTSPPRGTSTAMTLRFLHEIDPAWSSEMYAAFQEQLVVHRLGLPGVQEHLDGSGRGDVDSGPLVAGVSLSASAVAAGAARIHGDAQLADALLSVGEVLALPLTLGGKKRYAFGLLPVGDAFGAWTKAARPRVQAPPPAAPGPLPGWWRLPWLLLSALLPAAWWRRVWSRRQAME